MSVAGRRVLLLALLLAALVVAVQAKDKKMDAPPLAASAQVVTVLSMDGAENELRLGEEDRRAIGRVREMVRQWGRYSYSDKPVPGGMVLLLRRGKMVSNSAGTMHAGNSGSNGGDPSGSYQQSSQQNVEIESGFAIDVLWVCPVNDDGKPGKPVWSRMIDGGLDGERPRLAEMFMAAVDRTYPRTGTASAKP
jgi:hypothetical protein